MANTQIAISKNGKTTLATAGKYCERNIDINVAVASAADDIPEYVKSEADALIGKVVTAQNANTFTFAAISDLHYGNGSYTDGILHAGQALDYIRKSVAMDAFVVLGDYTDGYPADSVDNAYTDCRKINSILAPMEKIPNLRIMGNHDYYAGQEAFVHYHIQAYSDGVTWGNQMGGYFYRDFADKKLRIICVNTVETDNANLSVSDAQYNWFVGALDLSAKTDSENWSILLLSHHPLDWYAQNDTYFFCRILEAYKNGASWTNSAGTVSCNFTNKNAAALIGNIHGHIHNLLVDKIHIGNVVHGNKTAVDRIATPESCIGRANQYDGAWKEANTYGKTKNSADDTSFVVYCVDLVAQSVKAFCYGAGYDREISYAPVAPTVYNITNSLTNCTASGASTIVEEGTASVTISADSGYELPNAITVSGASYTWDKSTGTVTLSNPTGNVTITVVAVAVKLNYTNQIPLSINSDGSQYVGTNGEDGYKMGYRLNSSGTESTATNSTVGVTGFMPVKAGDVVYMANLKMSKTATGGVHEQAYIALYDGSFTKNASMKPNLITSSHAYIYDNFVTDANGYITSFKIIDKYNNIVGNGGYLRISADGMGANSILTVNQPISDEPVAPAAYNITQSLDNVVSSNTAVNIAQGSTFTTTLNANSGYEIENITVTMGGVDVTSTVLEGNTISISNVTGDIVITATAKEAVEQIINILDTVGYTDNMRFSASNGAEKADTGCVATGYIPVSDTGWNDIYYAWGAEFNNNNASGKCVIVTYDESKNVLSQGYMKNETTYCHNMKSIVDSDGVLKIERNGSTLPAYIRFSGVGSGANVVVTKNQPPA